MPSGVEFENDLYESSLQTKHCTGGTADSQAFVFIHIAEGDAESTALSKTNMLYKDFNAHSSMQREIQD